MRPEQDRRPGIRKLAEAIAQNHPDWTDAQIAQAAKVQYTMQTFDRLSSAGRRDRKELQDEVRNAARKAL